MSAVDRVESIRADFSRAAAMSSGGTFEDVLAAAGGGGPVLQLDRDPVADLILAGGRPPHVVHAATAATAGAWTPPGPMAATAGAVSPGATPVDAGWVDRLPAAGRPLAGAVTEAADRHGLDPRLLAALVWSESGFRADAVSHAGAIGLAQLMPGTAAGLGVDPHDPAQNLDGGARYLRQMLDRFGDTSLALAAYNAGPGRVASAGGIPAIAETRAYVAVVEDRFRSLGGTP